MSLTPPSDDGRLVQAEIDRIFAAARAEGQISASQATTLNELLQLRQHVASPRPRPRRTLVIILAALSAVVVSTAFFVRVPRTTVTFTGRLSALSFTADGDSEIGFPSRLRTVSIHGGEPLGIETTPIRPCAPAAGVSVTGADKPEPGMIGIGTVSVPKGSEIELLHEREPWSGGFTARPPRAAAIGPVTVTLVGGAEVASEGCSFTLRGDMPVSVQLTPASASSVAISASMEPQEATFASDIQASEIRFASDISTADGPPRPRSTILSGTVAFEGYDGRDRTLREGEHLRIVGASSGTIEMLKLRERDLEVRYVAKAADVRLGRGDGRSLSPTIIEYLRAKYGFATFWTTIAYLFGILSSIYYWLRGSRQGDDRST